MIARFTIDDFNYDDLVDEDREILEQRKKNWEDEQYNAQLSTYSLGLSDRDFF